MQLNPQLNKGDYMKNLSVFAKLTAANIRRSDIKEMTIFDASGNVVFEVFADSASIEVASAFTVSKNIINGTATVNTYKHGTIRVL